VKPRRPAGKGFRFKSLLPHLGLVLLLLGVWFAIPHKPREAAPGDMESTVPVIVVDAGHGGHDKGAIRSGMFEKDLALDTALRLERLLIARGFKVVMTRRDDRFLSLFERSQIANEIPRALFVSVHFNDNATASGEGVETFYASEKVVGSESGFFTKRVEPPPADNGAGFAQAVQQSLVSRLGVVDRGAKSRPLAVVRHTRCPAVLVEGGFMNNPAEARRLKDHGYRERLATAIADGVVTYHQSQVLATGPTQVARQK
jgi:N-acetylmuramoyl-L-alanine amidase